MTFSLSELPNEIILAIAKALHSEGAVNALARTSRHLYSLLNPFLYKYHADLAALRWAAEQGYASTLINLLDAGIDLYYPSIWSPDQRHTLTHHPLVTAIQYGHLHIVEIFLDRGGMSKRLKEEDYEWPLYEALYYGQIAILQFLLQKGVNPWDTGKFEAALLYAVFKSSDTHSIAAHHGNDELIRFLLAESADVNFQEDGTSPLNNAVLNDHYSTAKLLLQAGADPKMVDRDDIGPLSRATKPSEYIWPRTGGHYRPRASASAILGPPYPKGLSDELVAMTRLLLDYGADAAGPDGATALRVAMQSKIPELTNLLLMHGARVLRIHRSIHGSSEADDYWV
ncbi:hypothetical protein CNMCM5793_007903 [Aspergillus hiratsukae]|uniref:F-box domain-containing protein n=1 Tax=Aspergillus hiratsukae TaxID=1194566 RepID=A0A8H6UHS1_9EURO|nr:hypothetical protein CNMCM5793_007903 [Aspergillus hiratsukae]